MGIYGIVVKFALSLHYVYGLTTSHALSGDHFLSLQTEMTKYAGATVKIKAHKIILKRNYCLHSTLCKAILNFIVHYIFSSGLRFAIDDESESYSAWEDNKIVYLCIAIASIVIVSLAAAIAVLHIKSIPKSDKNKQR